MRRSLVAAGVIAALGLGTSGAAPAQAAPAEPTAQAADGQAGRQAASGDSGRQAASGDSGRQAASAGGSAQQTAGSSADHAMGSQIRKHEGSSSNGTDSNGDDDGVRAMGSGKSVPGIDVSKWDGTVNWKKQRKNGKRFAWVKATEGTGYKSKTFNKQYNGSQDAGLIRGAYHFARPASSSGTKQAKYFSAHGGGWSADGHTLPGAVDMEYNPDGSHCYGVSKKKMGKWIKDFSTTYKKRWHKYPVIYTSASWWTKCVGKKDFSKTNPLWVARYASSVGKLPHGWSTHTVWQYQEDPDKDKFNGSMSGLKKLAKAKD